MKKEDKLVETGYIVRCFCLDKSVETIPFFVPTRVFKKSIGCSMLFFIYKK